MRIIQVITELTPAGAERIVTDLSISLKNLGHEIMLVSLSPFPENRAFYDELDYAEISIKTLGLTKNKPWRILFFKRLISEFKPDLIHSHLIHANLLTRLSRIQSSCPLINTVHIAERRPGKWWHFTMDKMTINLCSSQTAVSKAVRDFHSAKLGIPADRMPVIYNGIKTPKSLNPKEISKLRNEWGVNNCWKVLGSVGRLDWQKGYDLFLNMLEDLSKLPPLEQKLGIVIIGEGPQRAELEEIITKNCPDNIIIRLPGFRSDAASSAGAFDLFLMPSRYEGFGLTLIEAMAHGMPILANNVDSLPELLTDYQNGDILNFDDRVESVTKINSMLTRKRISMENKFTVNKMVEEYLDLYMKKLDNSNPQTR